MSLCVKYRDYTERGHGKFTIVAYRESCETYCRGYVDTSNASELQCIECETVEEIEKTLIKLEKENLNRKRGQVEWIVRIYSGSDLTHPHGDSDDSDDSDEPGKEVLAIDFGAIEAKAEEEHEDTQRTLMAVKMMRASELAEKTAAEERTKELAELRRLHEKYGPEGIDVP
jgi:hypothetical protein